MNNPARFLHSLIDPAIRQRRLIVTNEQRRRIVQTMEALKSDKGALAEAAFRLIHFYGKPRA